MTQSFAPAARRPSPVGRADIAVAAPPEVARPTSSGLLVRLLPALMSVASLGVMAAAFFSGSAVTRNPTFLALPMVMLISVVMTAVAGRGRGQGAGIDADRVDYLGYLSGLRSIATETAAAQRYSLHRDNPDPDTLWTLIGGPQMWERRAGDSDFCLVRAGVGELPLASRLIAPEPRSGQRADPVTATALRRFLRAHSTVADLPIAIALPAGETVVIDGDSARVRALMRAMVCQLAVLHPPDQLLIAGAIGERRRADWDWLKWLPHNQHPSTADALGSARMVYSTLTEVRVALTELAAPRACGGAVRLRRARRRRPDGGHEHPRGWQRRCREAPEGPALRRTRRVDVFRPDDADGRADMCPSACGLSSGRIVQP